MSDKELEEYINKIEPNFDSHLEKGTIEMSNEYYNLLEEKMVRLINKNQELKKQLEEYENEPLTNKISRIDCVVSNIYSRNKTQQKEFISYLENMLDNENDIFSVVRVKDVLSKYKSIIGGK